MSETPSKRPASSVTSRPAAIPQRPYALLGGVLAVALALIVGLAYLGFAGPAVAMFTPEAALFAVASGLVVLSVASIFVFFTLRATNRVLAKLEQDVQQARDMGQDGRILSLEGSRTGSREDADDMSVEIERLESRIASLETPRVVDAPLVSLVVAAPAPAQAERVEPFGDVHAVIAIEGIGTKYAMLLNAADVYNTRQLWQADAEQVAATLGVPVASVDKWQRMAELLAVKGIGPQYAELLVRSNVSSIAELRDIAPDVLLASIAKTQLGSDVRIQGNAIGPTTVANWIRAARSHKPGRTIQAYPSGRATSAQ